MKTCSKCDELKELDQFNKDSRRKDGLRASCRVCDAAQKKAIRERNLEKYRERNAENNRRYRQRINDEVDQIISNRDKNSDAQES